jgi:hypothetical protein
MRFSLSILAIALCLISVSCKKKNNFAGTQVLDETLDSTAILVIGGNFNSGPYGNVTGIAEIYRQESTYSVKLKNFSSTNGPALHVYLSKEAMPINYLDLGSLKSINGNQIYSISGMPDLNEYKYVSIHCVQYNHLFGSALLN